MRDDVSVLVAVGAEEEAEGHSAGVSVGVRVWDGVDAGGAGEADEDGCAGLVEVGCAAESAGVGGGGERSFC